MTSKFLPPYEVGYNFELSNGDRAKIIKSLGNISCVIEYRLNDSVMTKVVTYEEIKQKKIMFRVPKAHHSDRYEYD